MVKDELYARLGRAYWNIVSVFGVGSEALLKKYPEDEGENVWRELGEALGALEEADASLPD